MKSKTTGTLIAIALSMVGVCALIIWRSIAIEAAYPAENASRAWRTKVWSRVSGWFKAGEVAAENVQLRREVASLALLRGDVERLEVENARLRRVLEYRARMPERWLAAAVLSRNGGAAGMGKTIRIDKGSIAGVEVGAVVVVPEGLVGKVTSVTAHTSEITLITDDSVKVAVEVETEDGEQRPTGIIYGGDDEQLLIRHFTNTNGVAPRCRVLTSGRGGIFPRGIEVGTLLDVRKDAKGLSYEGEVLPQVDYSALEDVFIRHAK